MATIFLLLSGCQQGVYRVSSLPAELAAPPAIDAQALDLSRLGGMTFRSDLIYAGDVLQVKAVTGAEEEGSPAWDLRVADEGTVDVPLIGRVRVAGLFVAGAEEEIRRASLHREIYVNPSIGVVIKERRTNRIDVEGSVVKPGTYELPTANSNLVAALYAAGGLSENADGTVEIRYPDHHDLRHFGGAAQPADFSLGADDRLASTISNHHVAPSRSVRVDLVAAARRGQGNHFLPDGAIIMVNKQPSRVIHVFGLAGNRAIAIPPNRDFHLLDALSEAGGPKYSIWIADRVTVIRKVPGSNESVRIKLSIRQAQKEGRENILLAAGDVVNVEENAVTFTLGTLREIVGIGATAATGAAAAIP